MNRTFRRLFIAAAVLGLLSACPAPFEQQDLVAGFDESPPIIALATPIDGDSYGSAVYVSGTVTDTADSGAPGQVSSLTCAVVSLLPSTAVTLNASDGSFGFLVDCGTFSGTIVLELTARDWNGNELVHTVNLVDVESDIPSFQLVPGNEKITASWSPVPSATGYTLYEYVSGFTTTLTDDITTYEYTGLPDEPLRNGDLVLLQLKADMGTDYRAAWSDTETCVSLSEFTLMPYTRSGDGEVTVEWYDAPAVDRYTVYRSTSRDPATFVVHRIVNANSFVDRDVTVGETYYYRVCPEGQTDIMSGIEPGTPHSIGTMGIEYTGNMSTQLSAPTIAMKNGDDLFVISRAGGATATSGAVEWFDISSPDNPASNDFLEFSGVSAGSWGDFLAAQDSDGRLYVVTKEDEGSKGFVVVTTTSGELTQGSAFTWDAEASFCTVENLFYYTDNAENEFYYLPTNIVAGAASGAFSSTFTPTAAQTIDDIDGTGDFPAVDWKNPTLLTHYNDGTYDYLYVVDRYQVESPGENLTNQFNLFAITLTGSYEPNTAIAVGQPDSDIFDSAANEAGDWDRPPTTYSYEATSLTADDGVLVFVAQMRKEHDSDPSSYGIALYDISDPVAPEYQSGFMIYGNYGNLGLPAIEGDRLLIPDGMNQGVHIFDISDLSTPSLQQFVATPGAFPSTIVPVGTRFFVPSDMSFSVLDETLPGGGEYMIEEAQPTGVPVPFSVSISGDRVYIIGEDGYLYILNPGTDGSDPTLVSGPTDLDLGTPSVFQRTNLFPFGNLLAITRADLLSSDSIGLMLVDVSDPTSPQEIMWAGLWPTVSPTPNHRHLSTLSLFPERPMVRLGPATACSTVPLPAWPSQWTYRIPTSLNCSTLYWS